MFTTASTNISKSGFWIDNQEREVMFNPSPLMTFIDFTDEEVAALPKSAYFEIHGQPVPMERPRVNQKTKKIYSPSTKKINQFKSTLKATIPNYATNNLYFNDDDMIAVEIVFKMKISSSQKNDAGGGSLGFCTSGGDIDNLSKFVLDGMQGVLFKNDKQIVKMIVSKQWGDDNGLIVIKLDKIIF